MKKPINFEINGPSYKDQIYTEYLNTKSKYNCKEFNYIWDHCQEACEKAYEERLRNKLSPIVNLIEFSKISVNQILDIPNQ